MIALQITSMKNFMNHLLVADTFDPFLLEEATISTALTVTIDGHINKDFYPADERGEDCIPWELQSFSKIKGLCFDLIKGKHTPLYFKFVLHMQPDKAAAMLTKAQVDPDVIRALVLATNLIAIAKDYIDHNYQNEVSLDETSRQINISPYYFSKLFKEEMGQSFIEYVTGIRMEKAKELLSKTDKSMKEICNEIGYADPNYFSRTFKKNVGFTPTEFKEKREENA